MRPTAFVAGILSATLLTSAALGADAPLAESLFQQGKRLLLAGDLAHACDMLAESNRQDPAAGTLLALALCFERSGRVASAWAAYSEAASLARREQHPDRERRARERVRALEPLLPMIRVEVPPELAVLPEARVLRNGELWPKAAWDNAVPVDPGRVTIEASAPGRLTWRSELEILAKPEVHVVSVPVLCPEPESAATEPPPVQAQGPSTEGTGVPATSPVGAVARPSAPAVVSKTAGAEARFLRAADHRFTGIAVTLGAIGLGAVGAGAYFGLRASSLDAQSRQRGRCQQNACQPEGYRMRSEALMSADSASLLFVLGGTLLAGAGITYWIGRPVPSTIADGFRLTMAARNDVSLLLSGRF